jgi:nicotinate dehydrogenase subunit B
MSVSLNTSLPVATDKRSASAHGATLTREARAALRHAGFTRRRFLQGAGVLLVSFSMRALWSATAAAAQFEGGEVGPPHDQLDSWIAIGTDGRVTAYTGKEEIGQGISTAQIQLVAEELCVPFTRVKLIYCDTSMTPDQGVTSGSQSHPVNFNRANLAQAAATAREALVLMASKGLNAPVEQLIAADGAVSVKGDATKNATYGELIGGQKFSIQLDGKAPRKPASEWTVLGKPAQRPDLPGLVTGQFEFVHNMRLPGMLHGRVVRPPSVNATLAHVDESSIAGVPGRREGSGQEELRRRGGGEAVAGDAGRQKLAVTWTPGAGLPKQSRPLRAFVRNQNSPRATRCW